MTVRIERSPDAASRKIAGKTFLVSPEAGRLLLLNEVGGRVWELLDGSRTPTEIACILTEEYESPDDEPSGLGADAVKEDVERFLESLRERGLLRAPAAGTP